MIKLHVIENIFYNVSTCDCKSVS